MTADDDSRDHADAGADPEAAEAPAAEEAATEAEPDEAAAGVVDDSAQGADAAAVDDDSAGLSEEDAKGIAWLVVGVLVLGVVLLLLVGAFVEAPLSESASQLAIAFTWLLAATYVGFRMDGSPRLRLLGAGAFLVAASARFVSLIAPSELLDAASLVALIVGALVLVVLAIR